MKSKNKLRLSSIGAIAITSIFLASCGEKKDTEAGAEAPEAVAEKQDTAESLTDELIGQINRFADTMISAKDKAAAEAAVIELGKVADDIANIASRMSKLETPGKDIRTGIYKKMNEAGQAVGQKLMANMEGIMNNEELANIIGPALMDFQAKMETHGKEFQRFGLEKEAPEEAPAPAGDAPAESAPTGEAPTEEAPAEESPAEEAPAAE